MRLPEVLPITKSPVCWMLIDDEQRVLAQLLYGTGMPIMEGLRLACSMR